MWFQALTFPVPKTLHPYHFLMSPTFNQYIRQAATNEMS